MLEEKISNEDLLKKLNTVIIEIAQRRVFMSGETFNSWDIEKRVSYMMKTDEIVREREEINGKINRIMSYAPEAKGKIHLSEIISKEQPKFSSNNLILSPTGSGKSTLIREFLIENKDHTVLLLVSNETLKYQLAPKENDLREKLRNRMFTSQNTNLFGEKKYSIHVMTYAEFGERMFVNNDFWKNIKYVFCDEIHSLPEYIKYGSKSNGGLIHSQRLLFNKHEDKVIYYFTATDKNLIEMEAERPGTMKNITTFDYRNRKDIVRFMPITKREIDRIEQIRQYLTERVDGFKYYNYKGIAFSKKISSLNKIAEIVIEEGFNPLVLWSENNSNHKLTEEQKRAKVELLTTNKIPEPYDFLIYNSAYQEGWDLKDDSVKLAIINTTNETEYIQALGRLRRDVDLLVYRTNDKLSSDKLIIDELYLNVSLSTEEKEKLSDELNLYGKKDNKLTWRGIKPLLLESGYLVEDKAVRIDGKMIKTSMITKS